MLSHYRVLDLTDERGSFAGFLLASLGAEVIMVEPPAGSRSRSIPPFAPEQSGVQASLWHWAYNRGKQSVVIDPDKEGEQFMQLVRGADVLLETHPNRFTPQLGFDYSTLAAWNPALIHTVISPFGLNGPRADWSATDLILMAAAGVSTLAGDRDRAPVRISLPQAWLHASAEAAGATLIALHERNRSGRGQLVDVSAQQAAMMAAQAQPLATLSRTSPPVRAGGGALVGPLRLRTVFPAKDGFVSITFLFGSMLGPYARRLMEWICEEGGCDAATRDKDWVGLGNLLHTGEEPVSEFDRIIETIARFTAGKTKQALFDAAMSRRLLIAPISDAQDILAQEHFEVHKAWEALGELSNVPARAPFKFADFKRTPQPQLGPPPSLGAHTGTILALSRETPAVVSTRATTDAALSGLKVLDLAWVMAGPAATRVLADYGATVVRIESTTRTDLIRALSPYIDNNPSPEHSAPQQNFNAGKLGVTLDPASPEGHGILLDLVRWADVVFDSFAPGAMRKWGLDYESLRKVNPSIIQVSSSLMGQTGPLAKFAGFGNLAAALAGFYSVTGWPDREPVGPFAAYTDALAPRFAVLSIMAALEHRQRTGEGQFVDLSQCESALHFYTMALLEYQVLGHKFERLGNADPYCAPHGTYSCQGEDRWIAIACESEDHWQALCEEMNQPAWSQDEGFSSLSKRIANQQPLDDALGAWTSEQDCGSLQERLQSRGIPAYMIQTSADLAADPQLRHREHFVEVPHPIHGTVFIEGTRFHLSRTPAQIERAGPTLGQHVQEVLHGLLGYGEDKVAQLVLSGALE